MRTYTYLTNNYNAQLEIADTVSIKAGNYVCLIDDVCDGRFVGNDGEVFYRCKRVNADTVVLETLLGTKNNAPKLEGLNRRDRLIYLSNLCCDTEDEYYSKFIYTDMKVPKQWFVTRHVEIYDTLKELESVYGKINIRA